MNTENLNENDRREISRYREYLRYCAQWDAENEFPSDPKEKETLVSFQLKRMRSHHEIYQKIYGP